MNRNPRSRHLKRINAPNNWLLDKLSGVWAPRPSPGPHKLRECMPLIIMLRNRLKYALTAREVKMITMSRHIRVDGKVRTDFKFPCGYQDVVTINRTGEHFRLLYDTKGRFNLHRVSSDEANWKLLKIKKKAIGSRGIPYIVTHDGRTIPYPNPNYKIHDTIKYDFLEGKVIGHSKFTNGAMIMITGGRNIGRVGIIKKIEKHPGSFDIAYIKDVKGHDFATRKDNLFVIGMGNKSLITLPKTKGIKYTIFEDREYRLKRNEAPKHNQNKRKELTGGVVLPPKAKQIAKLTKERQKLIAILRAEDKKNKKSSPKKPKKKKKEDEKKE